MNKNKVANHLKEKFIELDTLELKTEKEEDKIAIRGAKETIKGFLLCISRGDFDE